MVSIQDSNRGGPPTPAVLDLGRWADEAGADPFMADHVPLLDRRIRLGLDAGEFAECQQIFEEQIAEAPTACAEPWLRSVTLVHRATLAWRLGRITLAMELFAEGWAALEEDMPTFAERGVAAGRDNSRRSAAAAQTISMLGYLLAGPGTEALDLLGNAVTLARESGDTATLAHCLIREATVVMSRVLAARRPAEPAASFTTALGRYQEAAAIAAPGSVRRRATTGCAVALLCLGDIGGAERYVETVATDAAPARDEYCLSLLHWTQAGIWMRQHRLVEARESATRALAAAELIHENLFAMRYSEDLATICRRLGDPDGEIEALRRSVVSGRRAVALVQAGLGQGLQQRRIAVHAQRIASAAERAAELDPLTGLMNRRGLKARAQVLLPRLAEDGRRAALVLLDVDEFKTLNDRAGHTVGDVALTQLATLLRRECREADLVCRWAGDEFVVVLAGGRRADPAAPAIAADPGATQPAADSDGPERAVAERLRRAVDQHDWQRLLGPDAPRLTVSVGVAVGACVLDELFVAADDALYRAKRRGRNQVAVHRPGS